MSRHYARWATCGLFILGLCAGHAVAPQVGRAQVRVLQGQGLKIQVNGAIQVQADEANQAKPTNLLLLADRKVVERMQNAREAIAEGQFSRAVKMLQSVLDFPEDFFYRPDPDRPDFHVGMKADAERLIGELPAEGLQAYELEFGGAAQELLAKAQEAGRPADLADVVRRYFHTSSGYLAAETLGNSYMDQGQPLAAALCFERLLRTPRVAARREPQLSLKTAACWQRAGLTDQATRALSRLKESTPAAVAGALDKLLNDPSGHRAWIRTAFGVSEDAFAQAAEQWPIVRGTPERSAVSLGSTPFLKNQWMVPTTLWRTTTENDPLNEEEVDVRDPLDKLRESYLAADYCLIPAAQPLVVNGTVVFRSYSQLRAVDLATGRELWRSVETDRALDQVRRDSEATPRNANLVPQLDLLLRQRAWEDSTFGTLACDGDSVYCLADLGFWGPFNQNPQFPHPLAPKEYNRLTCYNLKTGKLTWEVGGPLGEFELVQAGTFFLGPPLPLEDALYAIVERSGLISLQVMNGKDQGKPLWSQVLVEAELPVTADPQRRQSGLSPSAADGILVCPTGAGAVVGLDLTTRTLLWAYRYQDKLPADQAGQQRMMMLRMRRMQGQGGTTQDFDRWHDAVPIIHDGCVLLTPRDSDELHCVDLADGQPRWKQPRGQGLYVAGVHDGKVVVVGRSQVEAFKLTDGARAWSAPVPASSGRGFLAGGLYHLPLATAEVATLDLTSGRVLTRSRSRDGRAPGNFVSSRGVVVAQTFDSVCGFRPLDELEVEITDALAKNPDDPTVLALRGEIRLNQGKLDLAYADLRRSLMLKPDAVETRGVLFESLLDGLRTDFAKSRAQIPEIEQLIDKPEQRGAYLRVLGQGLQAIGDTRGAFEIYLRLTGVDTGAPPLEKIEGGVAVRRDRWVRAQLASLYAAADEAGKREMDVEIATRLQAAREANSIEAFEAVLQHFGDHPAADEARRELFVLREPTGYTLVTERLLRQLQESPTPAIAGFATAKLASMLIAAGKAEEAAPFLDQLAGDYADVVCLDEKRGLDLAALWRSDEKVLTAVTAAQAWPEGEVQVEKKGGNRTNNFFYRLPMEGSSGPFFGDVNFAMDQRQQGIVALDGLGREQWKIGLNNAGVYFSPYGTSVRALNHIVLVTMGSQILAIDPLGTSANRGPLVLWREDLTETLPGAQRNMGVNIQQVMLPGGGFKFVATDQNNQPLGSIGALRNESLCLQRGRALMALDPLTGKVLWQRRDATPGSEIFGDDEYVFVVAPNATQATVLRMLDGQRLGERPIKGTDQRLAVFDRYTLNWNAASNPTELALVDVWTQEVAWSRKFAAGSKATVIDQDEAVVVEPTGHCVFLASRSGKALIDAELGALGALNNILVIPSRDQHLLFTGTIGQMQLANKVWAFGYNNPVVDGHVHAFNRREAGDKPLWSQRIDKQGLDLSLPRALPIVVFPSRIQTQMQQGNQIHVRWDFELKGFDRRTGRQVLDVKDQATMNNIDVVAQPDAKKIQVNIPAANAVLYELTFTGK